MEKRISQRTMGKLAAAAAVGLFGFGASHTDASLVIDIRATHVNGIPVPPDSSGDAPETLQVLPSDVVSMNVIARVTGENTLDDEGFQAIHGVFRTSTGGLLGDLNSAVVAPFNGAGSQGGSQIDIDQDGDFDIGAAPNGGQANMFWVPRSAAMERGGEALGTIPPGEEFLVGTLTWTGKGGDGETFLDFIRRRNPGNPGTNQLAYATWNEDTDTAGTAGVRNGTAPYSVDGLALSVIPEPTSAALAGLASLGLLGRRRNKNA